MKRIALISALTVAALALIAAAALAGDNGRGSHKAFLDGYKEVPSRSTLADGTLSLRIDERQQMIFYRLTYRNIEGGGPFAAHIHFARARVNGGIMAFLCPKAGSVPPTCPPVSGTVTGVITPADIIGPGPSDPPNPNTDQGIEPGSFAEAVRAIRAEATYANAHSTRFPGGEIRGQICDGDKGRGNGEEIDCEKLRLSTGGGDDDD
jgi:hypothetical protein